MSPEEREDQEDAALAQRALELFLASEERTVSLEELAAELGWELSDLADEVA